MWFTKVSLRNPVMASMVMLAFVVLGLFSYQRLAIDQFPNVDFPVVVVSVDYPGASPEVVESEVTRPLEEAINSVSGINALTSRSYDGKSLIIVEFQLHVDGRKAAEDVREKVASVYPTLRDEVKQPWVLRFDPASAPVWSVAVIPDPATLAPGAAPLTPVQMTTWADQVLKKRLENVRGVGAVNLVGATEREINIYLDPAALKAFGISPAQVVQAVRSENQDLPAGAIRSLQQERMVQINARIERPEDFARTVVAQRDGAPVRLGQLARIQDGAQEIESLALYNGQRTLVLSVQKAQDENTIQVVDGLNQVVAQIRQELPPGLRLETIADSARPIRVAVDNVRQTLIEGAVLTVLIVFLFLNSWRSTIITGLTLPIALIGTFWFMYMFGFTINMITLMALSLCVGLLIDDAIVVRENIVRHVQMGKSPYDAAMDGTQEIGLAVLATTLSIVAVFLPIGFMGGIIGKFFHEFGITIVAAVLISMFVSFTLDPMLSSVWHDPSIHVSGSSPSAAGKPSLYDRTLGRITAWFDTATQDLTQIYQRLLGWSLKHKLATLLTAVAVFIASLLLLPLLGTEFVPGADFSETRVNFETPQGSSIEATEAKARQVEAIVRDMPGVRYTLTTINTGNAEGKHSASMYIRLLDRSERSESLEQLTRRLRQALQGIAGIQVTHVGPLEPVSGQKQIEFSIMGPDLSELERISRQVQERLRQIPGLVDIDSSLQPPKPIVEIQVQREAAADLGLSVAAIASHLRTLVAGETIGNWRASNDETYDVNVRLAPEAREQPEQLLHLPLVADGGTRIIELNQVADAVESRSPSQINRRSMTREVQITANTSLRSGGEVSADIRRVLDGLQLPPGYHWEFGGSTKNMNESFAYAVSALALAVIFIYMILASQFKSFIQPLALMTSLPLTLIGVVLTLLMFNSAMSLFSIIGVVMLMGLVTKNAILLVDFAIRARGEHTDEQGQLHPGLPREQALLLAARVRLRPILMTTLAMVFGMIPLAFAISEGSEQRAPMGQAVIGGVITSSLLTLVVVPVVYCYLDDLTQWFRRLMRKGEPDKPANPSSHP